MAVQSLELQISDNAAQAASNVNKLAGALQRLQHAVQRGGIGELASRLQQISGATGAGALNQMVESISNATKQMESFSAAIERAVSAFSGFRGKGGSSAVGKVAEEAKQIADAMQGVSVKEGSLGGTKEIESTTEAIEEAGAAAKETKAAMSELGQAMQASGAWRPGTRASDVKIETTPAPEVRRLSESLADGKTAGEHLIEILERVAGYGRTASEGMRETLDVKPTVDKSAEAVERLDTAIAHARDQAVTMKSEIQTAMAPESFSNEFAPDIGAYMLNLREGTAALSSAMGELGYQSGTAGGELKMLAIDMTLGSNAQDELGAAMKRLANNAISLQDALAGLKGVLDGVRSRVGKLINSFARVARMRAFRAIIRAITTAFKEGLENLREYSKAINGLYAKDMAQLDNATLKMKNSLGAALGAAIQGLLPLIHTFINYIIEAANAVNQFIALLTGKTTWTKAVDVVASDFEDAKKKAGGAAKAAKNLLAAWDELNIIQSQSGGGGGGSSTADTKDYTKMFEESANFEGWIKKTVDFMESHLPIVQGLLAGVLGFLLGIKNLGVITLIIGLVTTIENAKDIAENGFTEENIQTAVTGALESAFSGALLFSKAGASGMLLGALTGLAVSAGITMVGKFVFDYKKGDITSAIKDGLGITAFGALAGFALGTMIGQPLIGTIAGAAVGIGVTLFAKFSVDKETRDGYITVTEKELDDYVATHMFKSDVRVTLRLINTAVENVEDARTAIADDLGSMSVPLHGLSLGINKQENYEKLKEEIFGSGGLVEDVQRYASSHLNLIETNMALMPIDAEVLSFGQEGWNIILNDFNDLGGQLSAELNKGFVDGVAQFDEEAVKAMSVEMAELSAAMAQQTAISTAQNNLQMNLMSGTMTAEEALAQYAKELEAGMINSEFQMAAGFEAQAAYYTKKAEFHPEEAEYWLDLAGKATDLATKIRDEAKGNAAAGVAAQMEPAYQMYRNQSANITPEAMLEAIAYVERTNPLGSYEDLADRVFERLFGEESYKWIKAGNLNPYSMFSPETLAAFQGTELGRMIFPSAANTDQAIIQSDQPPIIQTPGGQYATPEDDGESKDNPQLAESNSILGMIRDDLQYLRRKEWNVYIAPSANLGRTVTQSVRMWDRAGGGVTQTMQ